MNKNNYMTIDETFNLAVQSHQNNNLQDAQNYYQKILKVNPNHVNTHFNFGVLLQGIGDIQKAKDCYEKTIALNPNHPKAYYNLGFIFQQLREYQKAKDRYEKAIEINPNHVDAHNNLGNIFNTLGEQKKAKSCYEKAIEIDPNYINAHMNLGKISYKLEEYQKAKDCYEKVIKINPNQVNAHDILGAIFYKLEEYQKATSCYEKVIEIDPNYVDAHYNLGAIFQKLEEYQKAKDCYEKVIKIDPNHTDTNNNLSIILESYRFDYKSEDDKTSFKKLIISLLKEDNIDARSIFKNTKSTLFSDDEQNQLEKAINTDSLLSNKVLQRLLGEELFHLLLQKSILTDIFLEKLLTQLRCKILFNLENSNKDNFEEYFDFIISLAEQCWLNEYLYIQSTKEVDIIDKLKQKIENDKEVNELEVVIYGSYIPLSSSKNIIDKLIDYKSSNLLFNDLISLQIKEPLKEKELAKSISSLTKIIDPVSKKVQEQYEEHPYPKWRFAKKYLIKNYIKHLNIDINPNKIEYNNKFDSPNVLIAGCGTGNHPITTTRYKNSDILAVDLSLTSLAYAKRKTKELGYKNIEYLRADILQLDKLNKKFDIIESSGVLHHMKEPITGFKVLLDTLKPHGFLKIGLYSKIARRNITEIRKFIKSRNYSSTSNDIKVFRQDIINDNVSPQIKKIINTRDFYSISTVRDLLFHVQEHQFTIPQISKILEDLNLEFLGFVFQEPLIKKEYSKFFPEDKKNTSLDNWHEFEKKNPTTFSGMYQFWVRKI